MLEIKVGRTALLLITLIVWFLLFQSRPGGKPEGVARSQPKQPSAPKAGYPEYGDEDDIRQAYDSEARERVQTIWGAN